MIQGTIIKNGVIKLILTGTDDIDMAILKQLNGATISVITENHRLGDHNISGGLLITQNQPEAKKVQPEPEITPNLD